MTGNHDATASLLGYLYQCRYALLAALDEIKVNPGHELSIERFDDVAFEKNGDPLELIQTKHHGSNSNITDSSVDVWKTLLIWMRRINENPAEISRLRYVILTTATASHNSAIECLRKDDDQRNSTKALTLLREVAVKSKNESTKVAREMLVEMDDSLAELLFANIWVFDEAPNIIDARVEIENVLTFAAPVGKVDALTTYLEGWWFSRVISGLSEEKSSSISLSAISSKISEIRDGLKSDTLPLSPDIDELEIPILDDSDQRVFIQQMKVVGLADAPITTAIQDYYKAYTQRSRWAREELLLDDEAQRYERKLCDALDRERLAEVEVEPQSDEETKKRVGRKLFHWSMRHALPLRNRDEIWLSSGSYQMLSDRRKIGWHEDYKKIFEIKEAAE